MEIYQSWWNTPLIANLLLIFVFAIPITIITIVLRKGGK